MFILLAEFIHLMFSPIFRLYEIFVSGKLQSLLQTYIFPLGISPASLNVGNKVSACSKIVYGVCMPSKKEPSPWELGNSSVSKQRSFARIPLARQQWRDPFFLPEVS